MVVVRPDRLRSRNPARLIAPRANPRLVEPELPLSTLSGPSLPAGTPSESARMCTELDDAYRAVDLG